MIVCVWAHLRDIISVTLAYLSRIGIHVAYTAEEICNKSCKEPKSVVTLHRQSDRTTIL